MVSCRITDSRDPGVQGDGVQYAVCLSMSKQEVGGRETGVEIHKKGGRGVGARQDPRHGL